MGWRSRSAGSVGTERIRRVLVWPRPPFQPWTAMTVASGLTIERAKAVLRPNLRVSICSLIDLWTPTGFCCRRQSATARWGSLGARGTILGRHLETGGAVERSARFGSLASVLLDNKNVCLKHTADDWACRAVLGDQSGSHTAG